jgi:hypothetical protein
MSQKDIYTRLIFRIIMCMHFFWDILCILHMVVPYKLLIDSMEQGPFYKLTVARFFLRLNTGLQNAMIFLSLSTHMLQ